VLHQKRLWTSDWDEPVASDSTWWPLLGAVALTAVAFQTLDENGDAPRKRPATRARKPYFGTESENDKECPLSLFTGELLRRPEGSVGELRPRGDYMADLYDQKLGQIAEISLRCKAQELIDEHGQVTPFGLQEEEDIVLQDFNPADGNSVYDNLFAQPTDTTLRSFSYNNSEPNTRINQWLLENLRSSPLEARLFAGTFETAIGVSGNRVSDQEWQRQALDLWFHDGTTSHSSTRAPSTCCGNLSQWTSKESSSRSKSTSAVNEREVAGENCKTNSTSPIATHLPADLDLLEVDGIVVWGGFENTLPSSMIDVDPMIDDCLLTSAGFGLDFMGDYSSFIESDANKTGDVWLPPVPVAGAQDMIFSDHIWSNATNHKDMLVDIQPYVMMSPEFSPSDDFFG